MGRGQACWHPWHPKWSPASCWRRGQACWHPTEEPGELLAPWASVLAPQVKSGELLASLAACMHPKMESGELQAYWASVRHPKWSPASFWRRGQAPYVGNGREKSLAAAVAAAAASSLSSSSGPAPAAAAAAAVGAAEADNYFGGPGASDRLSSAQVEGAVVEGDEEVDRGPHVGDEDELRATGGRNWALGGIWLFWGLGSPEFTFKT